MAFAAIAVELGLVAADFVYHRYIAAQPQPPKPGVIPMPVVTVGTPYPLIWGRARVRSPVFAWHGSQRSVVPNSPSDTGFIDPNIMFVYTLDLLMAIGIGFEGGSNKLQKMWAGDVQLQTYGTTTNLSDLTGDGNFENWSHGFNVPRVSTRLTVVAGQILNEGVVEFLNGKASQVVVDSGGVAKTDLGRLMLNAGVTATLIPSYRGFLSAFLYNLTFKSDGAGGVMLDDGATSALSPGAFASYQHWWTGIDPQLPALSFEVTSYPVAPLSVQPGMEANIVDVIYDILAGVLGKLGLPASLVDTTSFAAAGIVLYSEGNGYSRSLEQLTPASAVLQELCAQADCVIYEDPVDGKLKIKLVRADYDITKLPEINVDNCEAIQGLRITSWAGIPNKILVTYPDRAFDYADNSIAAQNQANAVGQNGDVIEQQLSFPGCCTNANANAIATRELAARSRPLAQCEALVGRAFYATVPGDVVTVTWPEFAWDKILFRVAAVDRGTLANGQIKLSLIQEYFNVSRGKVTTGGIRSYPSTGIGGA